MIFSKEDTLWTGTPGDYTNKSAPDALAEVRKLVDNGNFTKATMEAVKLSGEPSDVCNIITIDVLPHLKLCNNVCLFDNQLNFEAEVSVKKALYNIDFIPDHNFLI